MGEVGMGVSSMKVEWGQWERWCLVGRLVTLPALEKKQEHNLTDKPPLLSHLLFKTMVYTLPPLPPSGDGFVLKHNPS